MGVGALPAQAPIRLLRAGRGEGGKRKNLSGACGVLAAFSAEQPTCDSGTPWVPSSAAAHCSVAEVTSESRESTVTVRVRCLKASVESAGRSPAGRKQGWGAEREGNCPHTPPDKLRTAGKRVGGTVPSRTAGSHHGQGSWGPRLWVQPRAGGSRPALPSSALHSGCHSSGPGFSLGLASGAVTLGRAAAGSGPGAGRSPWNRVGQVRVEPWLFPCLPCCCRGKRG